MAEAHAFRFLGGAICLDLANTLSERWSGTPIERLERYSDLVAWARQGQLISDRQVRELLREAELRPGEAAKVLAGARELRELVYRIFEAMAGGRPPTRTDLEALNGWLPRALAHLQLARSDEGFAWSWREGEGGRPALDCMIWPAVRSAAELLAATATPGQVRVCQADDCAWIFLDTSRNHSRRWCEMSNCGNRAKARRFYRRQQKGER
jgi:predicted RNA-binding Zn ribbon-like protein